jgi:hypothetical protein
MIEGEYVVVSLPWLKVVNFEALTLKSWLRVGSYTGIPVIAA